jgi:hypothetical protein
MGEVAQESGQLGGDAAIAVLRSRETEEKESERTVEAEKGAIRT